MDVIQFQEKYRKQVSSLWRNVFGYTDKRNDPDFAIDKKIAVKDGLFFIAVENDAVLGTIMAGYDGHRGWIYSLAVEPSVRKNKIGSRLLKTAEKELTRLGCVKVNLQVVSSNEGVVDFYSKQGYKVEPRISMGKQIHENIPE